MATSAGRRSCVVLAVALACFCFFTSGIADALNSQQQQIGDGVLSGGFRRSLLQVQGPSSSGAPPSPSGPSPPPAGSPPAPSPSDVLQGPPGPPPATAPSPTPSGSGPASSTLPPSNGPTQSQAPPPTRPPGNFFTPTPAPAQAPVDNGAVANPPPFDPYTPPPPDFVTSTPPPPADNNSSSSKKSTTRAAVGATVGVALVLLVALGAVVFFKPEWLPCCKEDRSRQAQYERHMTDF